MNICCFALDDIIVNSVVFIFCWLMMNGHIWKTQNYNGRQCKSHRLNLVVDFIASKIERKDHTKHTRSCDFMNTLLLRTFFLCLNQNHIKKLKIGNNLIKHFFLMRTHHSSILTCKIAATTLQIVFVWLKLNSGKIKMQCVFK